MMEPNTKANGEIEVTAELAAWSGAAEIERAADPGEFVVQACERAKQWLVEALENGDIEQIVELKSQAEAIRIYSMQKQLGKDAELSAAEIVRRAERGLGVAIRRGQEAGVIAKKGDPPSAPTDAYERVRGGRKERVAPGERLRVRDPNLRSPGEFFTSGEDRVRTYAVTDEVSDEQFEEAIEAARAEKNLSRANVVRKINDSKSVVSIADRPALIEDLAAQGYSSRQISKRLGFRDDTVREIARQHGIRIRADEVVSRSRHHDSNRIVRETVHALEGLAMGIDLVAFDDLDPDEIEDWTISLANSIRALNRLNKRMKEMVQ
jgi:hypothetical protein